MIQELPRSFEGTGEVNGDSFNQILKTDTHYIFERVYEEIRHFEVFERKHNPICLNFAKREYSEVDFKEIYPKSKDFGVWAWCCNNLEKAKQRI